MTATRGTRASFDPERASKTGNGWISEERKIDTNPDRLLARRLRQAIRDLDSEASCHDEHDPNWLSYRRSTLESIELAITDAAERLDPHGDSITTVRYKSSGVIRTSCKFNPAGIGEVDVGDDSVRISDLDALVGMEWVDMGEAFRRKILIPSNDNHQFRPPKNKFEKERGFYA